MFPNTVHAQHSHLGWSLAVGAHRTVTALTSNICHPVRVPGADRLFSRGVVLGTKGRTGVHIGSFCLQLGDFDGLDDDVVDRTVLCTGWYGVEFVNDFLGVSIRDFAEDGVAVLQPRGGHRGDEELRTVGAWAGVGHGQFIWLVEVELWVEFVFELVAGAANATAQRVAALDHEVGNDAVENGVVVERDTGFFLAGGRVGPVFGPGGQAHEVFNGLGCVVAEEFDNDVTAVGFDNGFMCSNTHEGYSSIIWRTVTVLSQREFSFIRPWPKEKQSVTVKSWQPGAQQRNLVDSHSLLWR